MKLASVFLLLILILIYEKVWRARVCKKRYIAI